MLTYILHTLSRLWMLASASSDGSVFLCVLRNIVCTDMLYETFVVLVVDRIVACSLHWRNELAEGIMMMMRIVPRSCRTETSMCLRQCIAQCNNFIRCERQNGCRTERELNRNGCHPTTFVWRSVFPHRASIVHARARQTTTTPQKHYGQVMVRAFLNKSPTSEQPISNKHGKDHNPLCIHVP